MRPGDTIWVRVFKSDGSTHRWWQARVEAADDKCIIVFAPAGTLVYHNPLRFPRVEYHQVHHLRAFYWPGRRHDLLEIYDSDGRLHELYVNIINPIELIDGEIHLVDHELDVVKPAGGPPEIVDQDEFAQAAESYGYSEQFMRESYAVAEQALGLLATWRPLGVGS